MAFTDHDDHDCARTVTNSSRPAANGSGAASEGEESHAARIEGESESEGTTAVTEGVANMTLSKEEAQLVHDRGESILWRGLVLLIDSEMRWLMMMVGIGQLRLLLVVIETVRSR